MPMNLFGLRCLFSSNGGIGVLAGLALVTAATPVARGQDAVAQQAGLPVDPIVGPVLPRDDFGTNRVTVTNGIPVYWKGPVNPIDLAALNPLVKLSTNADGKVLIEYDSSSTNAPVALKPMIEVDDAGAIGRNGSHVVRFDGNLNAEDSVVITMPDGETLNGHPIALSVSDAAGHRAWLGKIKDCEGQVIGDPGNQVIYSGAFSGIRADVLFTYEINSIEQDIIIRQQIPLPPEIDETTAVVECWTEFIAPPEPNKTASKIDLRRSVAPGQAKHLADDELLDFARMRIKPGRAFYAEGKAGKLNRDNSSPVAKRWLHENGRTFLVESADYISIKPDLEKLEAHVSKPRSVTSSKDFAFLSQGFPAHAKVGGKLRLLASASKEDRGVVLDYIAVNTSLLNIDFTPGSYSGPAAVGKGSGDIWNCYSTCSATGGTLTNLVWSDGSGANPGMELDITNGPGCWANTTGNSMFDTYIYPCQPD
jgi:hypothetical protein